MKKIAKFVGKLPLAGKYITETLLFNIMFSESFSERRNAIIIFYDRAKCSYCGSY